MSVSLSRADAEIAEEPRGRAEKNTGVEKKLDPGRPERRPRSGKRSKGDTTTRVPVDSRTTVQTVTQEVLTAGFGMGPGRHLRYGRVQLLFECESTFLLNRGPHRCGCGK